MTSSREAVLLQPDGGVLVVTLNRPERRNAVNRQMWRELREVFIGARDDAGVHAVVVTGSGGSFCAGQDLGEMTGEDDPGFGALMDTLCEFDKPLLAAVNGVGVGFGLTFLLHCDVVYIAEGARLRPPFVTLGRRARGGQQLPAARDHRLAACGRGAPHGRLDRRRAGGRARHREPALLRPTSCCLPCAPSRRASRASRRRRSGTPSGS